MEGNGDALRSAIEKNNAFVESIEREEQSARTTRRVDSGIVLDDSESEQTVYSGGHNVCDGSASSNCHVRVWNRNGQVQDRHGG